MSGPETVQKQWHGAYHQVKVIFYIYPVLVPFGPKVPNVAPQLCVSELKWFVLLPRTPKVLFFLNSVWKRSWGNIVY